MFNTQPPYSLMKVEDKTASRNLGQNYTNTTGRTLFIFCNIVAQVTVLNDTALAYTTIDGVNGNVVGHEANIAFAARSRFILAFAVMPGSTYAINTIQTDNGFVLKGNWTECY